jgi:hypothetical protein
MVQQSLTQGPPPGFEDPNEFLDQQAHVRFVRSTSQAEQMYARNLKVSVPCSWGIKCQLHVRPTLRERTGGAWLGEGPVTPLKAVQSLRVSGPWAQKYAKDLPQPANGGWGDKLRAAAVLPSPPKKIVPTKSYFQVEDSQVLGERRPSTSSDAEKKQKKEAEKRLKEKEEKKAKMAKLEKQEASIKAQMSKMLDTYGEAAIKTAQGYKP